MTDHPDVAKLLSQANVIRERALQARRLAEQISDELARGSLERDAEELTRHAARLERQAEALQRPGEAPRRNGKA